MAMTTTRQSARYSDLIPAGWYWCSVRGIRAIRTRSKGTPGYVISLRIEYSEREYDDEHAGKEIPLFLWDTHAAEKRLWAGLRPLGVLDDDDLRSATLTGRPPVTDVIAYIKIDDWDGKNRNVVDEIQVE